MQLTVVGCAGSFPSAQSPASCYLLEHDGNRVLLDLGNGSLGALQQHVDLVWPGALDAVLLSHCHIDHCADLGSLYVQRHYGPAPAGSYEITELSCVAEEFGGIEYEGSLTNKSDETRSFEVKVSFYDGERRLGSQESGYVSSVEPGQTATVDVTSFEDAPAGVRCQVDGVEFLGS